MSLSQEETLGLIQGLAAVVKEQNASNKSRVEELGTHAAAVKDLSDFIGHHPSTRSSALRLPNLTLPEYTGTEDLDRFLEQFTSVLSSTGAEAKYFLTFLKQQCRKDSRAFDILCNYDSENSNILPSAPTEEDYVQFYERAVKILQSK